MGMNFKAEKNDLWQRFLKESISPEELAKMDSTQMATKEMQKSRREAEIGDLTAIVQQEKKKVEEEQAGGKRMKVTHKGFEEIEDDPVADKNQLKTDEIDYDLSKKLETETTDDSSKK